MKPETASTPSPAPSPETKPSRKPDMLTPAELEALTQRANENDDYFKKVLAHLRPKTP